MEIEATPAPKSPGKIFPLEVWNLILNNLKAESDFASCNRTYQAWAELLKPEQPALVQLQNLVSPLKANCEKSESENIATIFHSVSTSNRSALEHLVLNIKSEPENNTEISNLRLEFPNLKKIWLTLDFIPQTTVFLATCTALQDFMLSIELSSWYNSFSTAENDPTDPVCKLLNPHARVQHLGSVSNVAVPPIKI